MAGRIITTMSVVVVIIMIVTYRFADMWKSVKGFRTKSRLNVMLVIADDLRPELGSYFDAHSQFYPKMKTPNIDKLAAKSLLLKRAYVQQALCSPSRTSFLTGRRPDTTHVYDLKAYFRDVGGNFTTMPQYFKQHGYTSIGVGKIFHPGSASGNNDDMISWSEPAYRAPNKDFWHVKNSSHWAISRAESTKRPLPDDQVADYAIHTLTRLSKEDKPFFLAVGFYRPHLPFIFHERFLDLYPKAEVSLPENGQAPVNMPTAAWSYYGELRAYRNIGLKKHSGQINSSLPVNLVKDLRRYYYASVTSIDFLLGNVLQKLKDLKLTENTIVVFLGDHGWQLGEHGEWSKHTNFEVATHAPMMVHIPGLTDKGIVTEKLTEFVDLFPTLVDAAGLPSLPKCPENSSEEKVCAEGDSLMELLTDPKSPLWKTRAFSQLMRGGSRGLAKAMGYSMRTDQYRYTEWVHFTGAPLYQPKWNVSYGTELYDHKNDPQENWNRADDPDHGEIRLALSAQLHSGWRAARRHVPSYKSLIPAEFRNDFDLYDSSKSFTQ